MLQGEKMVLVACGWRHTICVSASGGLYTYGWSKYGQLGHGDFEDHLVPHKLEALSDSFISQVFFFFQLHFYRRKRKIVFEIKEYRFFKCKGALFVFQAWFSLCLFTEGTVHLSDSMTEKQPPLDCQTVLLC